MTNELATQSPNDGGMTLSVDAVVRQREKIKDIQKRVMAENIDFGIVPGCQKPSLFKSGAEKLCSTFMLAADPKVEDISTSDEYRYRVTLRLTHQATGVFMGCGVGEAGTNEEKYHWRKVACSAEYEATDAERRRLKWNTKGESFQQVRTNPADLANTVLKMAKKRAQIDAVLTVLGASDLFTQDVEDMPAEYLQGGAKPAGKTTPKPAPAAPKTGEVSGVIEKYYPPKGKGPHCIYIKSVKYVTFDATTGGSLAEMAGQEIDLTFHTVDDGKYVNNFIDGFAPASASKPEPTKSAPAEDPEDHA